MGGGRGVRERGRPNDTCGALPRGLCPQAGARAARADGGKVAVRTSSGATRLAKLSHRLSVAPAMEPRIDSSSASCLRIPTRVKGK